MTQAAVMNGVCLGFLSVLPVGEVCLYQRLKASVSALTHVEAEDKQQHQESDEHSPQRGAQHDDWGATVCLKGNSVGVPQLLR